VENSTFPYATDAEMLHIGTGSRKNLRGQFARIDARDVLTGMSAM
jgi:hypothetical protein